MIHYAGKTIIDIRQITVKTVRSSYTLIFITHDIQLWSSIINIGILCMQYNHSQFQDMAPIREIFAHEWCNYN